MTHETPRELARQSETKGKQALQNEAKVSTTTKMQSKNNLPYELHRTPSKAHNTEHKLGIAFSYLERKTP